MRKGASFAWEIIPAVVVRFLVDIDHACWTNLMVNQFSATAFAGSVMGNLGIPSRFWTPFWRSRRTPTNRAKWRSTQVRASVFLEEVISSLLSG